MKKNINYCLSLLLCIFFFSACSDQLTVSNNESHTQNEGKHSAVTPLGFEPFSLNFATTQTRTRAMSADIAFDSNSGNKNNTRAIIVKEDGGKTFFSFEPNKESQNMIIILKQKNTNNMIYLSDVKYTGKNDGTLKIKTQTLKGYKTKGMPTLTKDNFKDWYALFIYDNPLGDQGDGHLDGQFKHGHTAVSADGKTITMPVGVWHNDGNYISTIDFCSSGNTVTPLVHIPFYSNWIPLTMDSNNSIVPANNKEVVLNPQGVLMRVDIENQSRFPIRMQNVYFETNILHANIKYDLSPNAIPEIKDNLEAQLKWSSMDSEANRNYKDAILMGKSFVGNEPFNKNSIMNAKILGSDNGKTKQKLNAHYYIWGMPKTTEEIKQLGNGNIPMTAFYTFPQVDKGDERAQEYVTTDDPDFDNKVLNGAKPAPKLVENLSMATKATLCGKNGKVLPIKVTIKDREPSPLERFCKFHSLKPTTPDKPRFSNENEWVKFIDNEYIENQKEDCYFDYTDITTEQPASATDNQKANAKYFYRILGTAGSDGKRHPIEGYHIPNAYEVGSIIPATFMKFDNEQNSKWDTFIEGSPFTEEGKWVKETYNPTGEGGNEYLSFYKNLSQQLTNEIAGVTPGAPDKDKPYPYCIALRGFKGETDANSKCQYTDALGFYLYTSGNNAFFVEYMPLTKDWVTRFDGRKDVFVQELLNKEFWKTFKSSRLFRSIAHIENYPRNNVYSNAAPKNPDAIKSFGGKTPSKWENLWGSMLWLSGCDFSLFEKNESWCWGVAAQHGGGAFRTWKVIGSKYVYNYNYQVNIPFASLRNFWRTKDSEYNGKKGQCLKYGVHLVKDKLW